MKTGRIQRFMRGSLAVALVGVTTFVCAPANAAHELIYGVDQNNNLISFWSDAPGTILSGYSISGIQNAEQVRGIDYDSLNNTLYAMGSFGELYTINPSNGHATMVGTGFGVTPNGTSFGWDVGPSGAQLTSNLGQSLLINLTTGVATAEPTPHYTAGDPFFGVTPRVDALAYDPGKGIWYADDTLQNSLATFNPITGVLTTIGANGLDAARFNGLDVSTGSEIMYFGTPAASSDPQANLYTVNKLTGLVTLVGQIDVPGADTLILGLTVVPEPSSFALLALGAAGLLFAHRRQR